MKVKWLQDYQYRKSHVINPANGAGTDYQVPINVFFTDYGLNRLWNSGVIATGNSNDTARNLLIDGNYLYAVSSSAQKLVIYDISNPAAPVLQSLTATTYLNLDVRKTGNYLFVSNSDGFDVWDVSNVSAPTLVKHISVAAWIHGTFISGNYYYCCMHNSNEFRIYDITDPVNPTLQGRIFGTIYIHGPHDVYVEGNYAYLTNYLTVAGEYGFVVIDVTDKLNPVVVGYAGDAHKNSGIFKVGNYCYVGSHSPDTGMRIYDVSNPTNPVFIGQFFTQEGSAFGYWMDDYDLTTLAVIGGTTAKLYMMDISNPTSPTIKAFRSTIQNVANVVVNGKYLYVSTGDLSYNWRIRSFHTPNLREAVSVNQKSRTDFGDIRFTSSDGITLLDYWMEDELDGQYALFWVKVSDDLSTNPATIYVYYGNANLTTTSDIKAASLWNQGDDFNDNSRDTTMWDTVLYGTGSVNEINQRLEITTAATADYGGYVSVNNHSGYNFEIRILGHNDQTQSLELYIHTTKITNNNPATQSHCYRTMIYSDTGEFYAQKIVSGVLTTLYHGTLLSAEETMTIRVKDSVVEMYEGETLRASDTYALPSRDLYVYIGGRGGTKVGTAWADNLWIRKYVDPEPSHGVWGKEEVAGGPITWRKIRRVPLRRQDIEDEYYVVGRKVFPVQLMKKVVGKLISKIDRLYGVEGKSMRRVKIINPVTGKKSYRYILEELLSDE